MSDSDAIAANAEPSSTLPLWQRRIVALVQSGVDPRDAAESIHVSWASVDSYTRNGGHFAEALAAAETGRAVLGAGTMRDLAVAHAGGLLEDAVRESRNEPDGRIRAVNRRLALEASGEMVSARGTGANVTINAAQVALQVLQMTGDDVAAIVRAHGDGA